MKPRVRKNKSTVNYRYNVIDGTLKKLRLYPFLRYTGMTYFLQKHSKLHNIGISL